MNSYNRKSNTFLRFLSISLSAILLFGSVSAFAGAKATLQGGSLFFESLIETKKESIIRTKVTGNQATDTTLKINVEYIEAGSEIVLGGAKDLDGTIVGVLSRNELNEQGTRITKSVVEATIASDKVHVGTMNLDDVTGIAAEQSIGVSFDNKNLPGAMLGDEKALYELQLLFTPKNQKPFFYTYYLRLVSADDGKTSNATTNNNAVADTSKGIAGAPQTVPPVDSSAPDTVPPVANSTPAPVDNNPVVNTVPSTKTALKGIPALPSSTKISVNGKLITCEVYSINDINCVKLRDFAMALNNTTKSFSVNWIEAQKAININSHATYKPIGGELVLSEQYIAGERSFASSTKSSMLFDNVGIDLEGYIIKGNTYFKVRDLAQLMDVSVQYNQASDTMACNTDKMYEQ